MEIETEDLETIPEEIETEGSSDSDPEETEPETSMESETGKDPETESELETESDIQEETKQQKSETESDDLYNLEDSASVDTEAIVQAIDQQTEMIRDGNIAICIALGLLVGIVLIQGIRLRRV